MKQEVNPGAIIIEGHVQGLSNTRSLGEAGIPVFVVDTNNCIARYSKYCRKFFRCPDFIKDEFADFLIGLAREQNIIGWVLIPSNDHAVYTLSKHKERLEHYFKVITPSFEILENIYDKGRLLSLAEKEGIPYPKTWHIQNPDELQQYDLPFPVMIKGRFGLSFYKALGRKVFLASDKKQLRDHLTRISKEHEIKNTLIQELIPYDGTNKTISFTAFCVNGEIRTFWMGIKLREHPIQFGTATFAQSVYKKECYEKSVPLLKALNFSGVCEIEYLKDPRDGKFKLIEINARTWLWVGLAKACGVDYAKYIYNYVNNIPDDYPADFTEGIKWINYLTDSVFSLQAIVKNRLSFIDYLKSLKGQKVTGVFNKADLRPSLMFLLLSIFILKKRM